MKTAGLLASLLLSGIKAAQFTIDQPINPTSEELPRPMAHELKAEVERLIVEIKAYRNNFPAILLTLTNFEEGDENEVRERAINARKQIDEERVKLVALQAKIEKLVDELEKFIEP